MGDLLGGSAGAEQPPHAHPAERLHVLRGDDPAAGQELVPDAALAHQAQDLGEQRHVGAGEDRERHHVDVLLERGLDHLLGRLVEPGVDHFHPGVAQRRGHHLGAPVVAVEARLAHQHSDLALHGSP